MRRSSFRQGGVPHQLLVLADVSRPLREEERQAWQRLIRVLGHELNNSLAPIQSIAGSLQRLAEEEEPPPDWREDLRRGLAVIASRTEALSRFTNAYAKLARLPPPQPTPVAVDPLLRRITSLETRLPVGVIPGPPATLSADADQLEQLLINLVRNAADAALETQGGVAVGWKRSRGQIEIWVADDGPGPSQHEQPLRAVLHDQARRVRYRSGPVAPDRGGARRLARAGEPPRPPRLHRAAAASAVGGMRYG